MSLKNKLFSGLTMAFAVAAFSTAAMAQEATKSDSDNTPKREWRRGGKGDGFGKGFRRGGRGGGFMRELRGVDLTDAQKQQIKTIMEANRPDQATMEEMKTLHQAKREGTLTADQQERMKVLRDQSRQKGEALHQQVLAILTPEQLQQIEKNKQEMKQRWEERKQLREQRKQQAPQTEDKDN